MEIILLEDIDKLGYKDEVVTVRDGYARNFLIPQRKAMIANKANKKALDEKLKQQKNKHDKMIGQYKEMADKISGSAIKIGAKVGTTDKIFGSVTSLQIAEAIKNQTGVEVDRKKIKMPEEIKTTGNYTAEVELYKDIRTSIQFEVIAE